MDLIPWPRAGISTIDLIELFLAIMKGGGWWIRSKDGRVGMERGMGQSNGVSGTTEQRMGHVAAGYGNGGSMHAKDRVRASPWRPHSEGIVVAWAW